MRGRVDERRPLCADAMRYFEFGRDSAIHFVALSLKGGRTLLVQITVVRGVGVEPNLRSEHSITNFICY